MCKKKLNKIVVCGTTGGQLWNKHGKSQISEYDNHWYIFWMIIYKI